MKRLSLIFTITIFSCSLYAALPAANDPTLINVPEYPGGFVLGVTGLYLQPTDSHRDLDFFELNGVQKNVSPGFDWGYGFNLGYIFPQTGNDIAISYWHLDTDDRNVLNFIDQGQQEQVTGKAEYDINQVDLTAGQAINVGCRLILHPVAGLRYADLERKLGLLDTLINVSNPPFFSENRDSDFSGIGPLAGLDATYYLTQGLGLIAHVDSALLAGDIDSKATILQSGGGLSGQVIADNNLRMVTNVNAKLGADYTYMLNNAGNSYLTLTAGYQVSHYWNAVDKLFGIGSGSRETKDFGLNGPFASLTLSI